MCINHCIIKQLFLKSFKSLSSPSPRDHRNMLTNSVDKKETERMKTYGLIGYPLGHSFSRGYFTDFFSREGIDATYKNFELPHIEALAEVLQAEGTLQGFNVTIPYKQQVFAFLDELSDAARAIGAVNVVKVTRHNEGLHLKGYNTDYIGFTDSIRPHLKPHLSAQSTSGP